MANLNKVMLIGRLTRDPEVRTFANGGKVAKFGFAVNNKRKNPQTGQWEDEAVFLEVDAFNRGEMGKKADLVEQYLRKGNLVFIEGHLKLDQWTSQDGQKRSQIKIVLDNLEFLERRPEGEGRASPTSGGGTSGRRADSGSSDDYDHRPEPEMDGPSQGGNRPPDEEIPF